MIFLFQTGEDVFIAALEQFFFRPTPVASHNQKLGSALPEEADMRLDMPVSYITTSSR